MHIRNVLMVIVAGVEGVDILLVSLLSLARSLVVHPVTGALGPIPMLITNTASEAKSKYFARGQPPYFLIGF
jgi:hypothetical protein